ncbi:putative metalloprotease [Kutzneria buriramensis]|uniref:Putative metalloprotease n=1 Tax=Kutzneria buriramensis TaxID=1045776 RepID=A0A3E0HAQ7_9PSEU|nr:putative metalloprotease [Kutzneria buriramensis]
MLVALLAVLTAAGCASIAGVAEPITAGSVLVGDGVEPSFVQGTDDSTTDRIAASTITDVQAYWRQNFPTVFGKAWRDVTGGVYSVDTSKDKAKAPPCTDQASDVEGNAFYCPAKDSVAWDRAALLPVLRDQFGDASVVVVLAHEMGHAVQNRTSPTQDVARADPDRYPTILIETMADCYSGAFVRSVVDGKAPHLRINAQQLDKAISALATFRDPVGTSAGEEGAHGDAFDRVSAFQDGYQQGPKLCAGMTVANRQFTQRTFTDPRDQARGGNLTLPDLVNALTPDASSFFASVAGSNWSQPKLTQTDGAAGCGDQGPVAYCPDTKSISLSTKGTVPLIVSNIGDFAAGTLIVTRYALAALSALGKPVDGPDAGKAAVCLAGAYSSSVLTHKGNQLQLSPGDLDKSVGVLLGYDYASRGTSGKGLPTGFDRVLAFRAGFSGGPKSCGV